MTTLEHSTANQTKVSRVEATLAELLQEVLKRGFFGAASLQVSIQDGTIQNMKRTIERNER